MTIDQRTQIVNELLTTQQQIIDFFTTIDSFQTWQPARDQWSFRQIAAHLATAEKECLQERVKQIASGTNPRFSFYLDTDSEFSERAVSDSLEHWVETRREIIDYVNDLPEQALAYTGHHITFGTLTVFGYLHIFLEHDQRHWQELQRMLALYRQSNP